MNGAIMIPNNLNNRINETINQLSTTQKKFLKEFPISNYIKSIKSRPEKTAYNYLSNELKEQLTIIKKNYGEEALLLYNRLVLVSLIKVSINDINNNTFPDSISDLYFQWFNRILEDVSNQECDIYNHENDLLLKDLSICSLKLFPAGIQVVEKSGIGRRYFICNGISQFLRASTFYLLKQRSNWPFYQIHMNMRYLSEFSSEGWFNGYLRIAEMVEMHPEIVGIFSSSWFFDPDLYKVSPRLEYLSKLPKENRAILFNQGTSQSDINNALAKSKTRRRLYKEGKYKPTGYLYIWLRSDLLNWAKRNF